MHHFLTLNHTIQHYKVQTMASAAVLKTAKSQRSAAKGKFHRILNSFVYNDEAKIESDVLSEILADLNISYGELEIKHAAYIEQLDPEADEDDQIALEAVEQDMSKMYNELCKARSAISVRKKAEVKVEVKRGVKVESRLMVKKLEAPSFSGSIREYPTFKRDYDVHMFPSFGEDPFSLRSCLSGKALEVVQGIGDDYKEMRKRLELKFGCPEKLVDVVMSDISRLKKVPDGDDSRFLRLVEVVERSWLDLMGMGLEREMNTSIMISKIEKLIPTVQRREWALRRQEVMRKKKDSTFLDLLDFLRGEKEAIEYMSEEVRDDSVTSGRKVANVLEACNSEREDEQGSKNLEMRQMKELVEGLVQVVKGISNYGSVRNESWNKGGNKTNKRCWLHDSDSHEVEECFQFCALDPRQRLEEARKHFACFLCLKNGHLSRNCPSGVLCVVSNNNNEVCGKRHHKKLHFVDTKSGIQGNNISENLRESSLLMVSEVKCGTKLLAVLWDPGANISLITHYAARKLGLKGKEVALTVTKVGNQSETINTKEYVLPLKDNSGDLWRIPVYGMEELTSGQPYVDTKEVSSWFNMAETELSRPVGPVDVLVGTDWCQLLPNKIAEKGNLQLLRNQFGHCIRGHHPLLKLESHGVNNFQIHLTGGSSIDTKEVIQSFMDVKSSGVTGSLSCSGCKCGKCALGNNGCNIQEVRELRQISEGLTLDTEKQIWVVRYPWKKLPELLPNNYFGVVNRLKSTERRLRKRGKEHCNDYNNQIQDMLDRNVARRLSEDELKEYDGPIHYIPNHEVMKPDSVSTPMRIVFNASESYMGHCLNDYRAKGPNVLSDILSILLRFRQHSVALVADIKKMYNSIRLSLADQHTHRFVWRWLDENADPIHYILQTVTFGDRHSGVIADLALKKTAELMKDRYPLAAEVISQNSYVDDLLKSVGTVAEAKRVIQEVETVLGCGGFKVKHWVVSGECSTYFNENSVMDVKVLDSPTEKVLGMHWFPKKDVFQFKVNLNFNARNDQMVKPKLSAESFEEAVPKVLTSRMVLS